jgi:hypothetical protein
LSSASYSSYECYDPLVTRFYKYIIKSTEMYI